MKIPEMKPTSSSQIASIGYDEDESKLFIQFTRGGIYAYSNVSEDQFNNLLNSASIGKEFAKEIKGQARHPFVKVEVAS